MSDAMVVEAARRLRDDDVCFVGIGLPSLAANLARATHAPDCVLIYESGAIGAKPTLPPLSTGIDVDQARKATGWELRVAPDLAVTEPPTAAELAALRRLGG